jgi:signal transduction histidine kinase
MTTRRPLVLCVDDEAEVLAGLELTLRQRFEVRTALGGLEALSLLTAGRRPDVIVSDLAMPGMDGPRFLARSRVVAPGAVRLLLSGQATVQGAAAAVNEGAVFRILEKPIPPQELLAAVEAAVEHGRQRPGLPDRTRDRADEALRQLVVTERRAALGTLAGAIGGELSNLVVSFDLALDRIGESLARQEPPEAEALSILRRVEAHLTVHARTLRDLATPQREVDEVCELGATVEGVVSMLRFAGLLRHVRVDVGLPDGPAHVPMPRTRAEQVLINLLENAVEAIDGADGRRRGHLFVGVARDEGGRGVTLTVEDNGTGVPEVLRSRLFEPYATSRPRHHAGLGLFMVKRLVEASHGQVSFTTREGRGTVFTVRLPRAMPGGAGI